MSEQPLASSYAFPRNNICGGRRNLKNPLQTKGRALRADRIVDEPEERGLNVIIAWMQRHVDRYLQTEPGSPEATAALNEWRTHW